MSPEYEEHINGSHQSMNGNSNGINPSQLQLSTNYNRYRSSSSSPSTNNPAFFSQDVLNLNVSSYSHRPQIIPPYVLDKIAQVHYKDETGEKDIYNFKTDPFISALDNNWGNFISTVKQPVTYTNGIAQYDTNAMNRQPDLSGTWGGDERLRNALATDEEKASNFGTDNGNFFSKIFHFKESQKDKRLLKKDEKNPRVRSKAGYWMSDEKRADLKPTLQRIFLNNPYIPLTLRSIIFVLSIIALGLACSIFVFSQTLYDGTKVDQQPSTIMAICVQSCALVYLIYITYDEYSGKPLGLRNPLAKMRLILLDLLFIIFSSANLSLTFNTLFDDRWVCKGSTTNVRYPNVAPMCKRQRGLAAFLFLVLIMWVITFTISIVRVVERVAPGHK